MIIPAPVKLESLQVLSAMSRNYFDVLMAPHITHIVRALDISLSDRYTDLRLHAGRAVDFLGQAMNRYISSEGMSVNVSSKHYSLYNFLTYTIMNFTITLCGQRTSVAGRLVYLIVNILPFLSFMF